VERTFGDLRQINIEQSSALLNTKDGLRLLKNELNALQVSSRLLNDELKVSRQESAGLQAELTKLKSDLETLEILLNEAEKRLKAGSESFRDYRLTAEKKIQALEADRNFWVVVAIIAGILGAGGTVGALFL
jgi:predicted  nucleic acid-binding Zn-ribbon protein